MWTNDDRGRYDRSKLRYPSDLTDDEWGLIKPLIPPAKRVGNKRTVVERAIVDGLMYILSTGCQWAALPKDLPPRSTVNDYFRRWREDGTLNRIHHVLYVACRDLAGREASPQGSKFRLGLKQVCEQINVEIVKRSDVGTFVVLPKRWIVETTIAWLNRCRRLAKDWNV